MQRATLVRRRLAAATLGLTSLAAVPARAACPIQFASDPGSGIGVFRLVGTTGKQTVVVGVGSGPYMSISLDCNGDGDFLDAALGDINDEPYPALPVVELQLGGSDTITINLAEDLGGVEKTVAIHLAGGVNTVDVNGGAFVLDGGTRLVFDVLGAVGADTVRTNFPSNALTGAAIQVRMDLGAGNDVASVYPPNVGIGGSFELDAALGPGTNTLTLYGKDVGVGGSLVMDVLGGTGIDTVTVNVLGNIQAREHFSFDLGGGNDSLAVNFNLPFFHVQAGAESRFDVAGGAGNDKVSFSRNGTTASGTTLDGTLDIHVSGGAGNDPIMVDLGGGGFDATDGGTLRLRADGGAGADTLTVTLESSTATTALYDVSLSGGNNADKLYFTQDAGGSGTHKWLGGYALVDGSFAAPDLCTVNGNVAQSGFARRRNCEQ